MLDTETQERLALLEGLISAPVGERLAELAARVPSTQAIVEIGSYKGKSACYLAAGAKSGNGAMVYAIDPWDLPGNPGGRFGFDTRAVRADFHNQVQQMGLADRITALQDFSWRAVKSWTTPIGLLYIDGSHTAKDVALDWSWWSPYLADGSYAAFDDYDTPRNPGVKKVVDEIRKKAGTWTKGPHPLIVGTGW